MIEYSDCMIELLQFYKLFNSIYSVDLKFGAFHLRLIYLDLYVKYLLFITYMFSCQLRFKFLDHISATEMLKEKYHLNIPNIV